MAEASRYRIVLSIESHDGAAVGEIDVALHGDGVRYNVRPTHEQAPGPGMTIEGTSCPVETFKRVVQAVAAYGRTQ